MPPDRRKYERILNIVNYSQIDQKNGIMEL